MQTPPTTSFNSQRAYGFDITVVALLFWAAILLSNAAAWHRYAYYETLRNVVFGAWVAAAFRFWIFRWFPAVLLAAIVAWLFNPIAPITMRKWQWQPYDHWTMLLSIGAAIALCALSIRANRKSAVVPAAPKS
jgi:hypothetical protein